MVANAYVGPIVSRYLGDLEQRLQQAGFRGDLMIMQSNGGLSDIATARRQCIQMLESGPAGGVVGTMALCEALDLDAAIAFNMGGTTAKASVVRRGQPSFSPDYFIGGYNEGLAIRIPVLDIVEVGTGGGSIAWMDDGGALHVGPHSAGAEPGPACYHRDATAPTITDANIVLGRLAPEQFLGGEMRLDRHAAVEALRAHVAVPLDVDLERAAFGLLRLPSRPWPIRCVMSPLSVAWTCATSPSWPTAAPDRCTPRRWLGSWRSRTVIIPPAPGHFSALGVLMARSPPRLRADAFCTPEHAQHGATRRGNSSSWKQKGGQPSSTSGVATDRIVFKGRAADMRYVGQEHAVTVRLPNARHRYGGTPGNQAAV